MKTHVLKTKSEKKDFLENDFIERLIRIEQKVSAKYGSLIRYNDTYCYKNLSPMARERYERYLKLKKNRTLIFGAGFIIPLFGILLVYKNITGNVVLGSSGINISVSSIALFSFLAICLAIFLVYSIQTRIRRRRFDPLFTPLEKTLKKEVKKDL